MKIQLSDHAKKQRVERRIPLEQIIRTVKNPKSKAKSFKNRQLLRKRFSGKILEVVTIREENTTMVITEYCLEEES